MSTTEAGRRLSNYNIALAEAQQTEAIANLPGATSGQIFHAKCMRDRADARLAKMKAHGDAAAGAVPAPVIDASIWAAVAAATSPAPAPVAVVAPPQMTAEELHEAEVDAVVARILASSGGNPAPNSSEPESEVDALVAEILASAAGAPIREPSNEDAEEAEIQALVDRIMASSPNQGRRY